MTSADEPTQEWVLDEAPERPADAPGEAALEAPEVHTGATAVPPGEVVDEDTSAEAARRRNLSFLLAGALVLALIAGVIWAVVATTASNRRAAIREVAQTYLQALAAADAGAALDTLAERPLNTALLTDGVLDASRRAAAWADITVGEPVGDGNEVTVPVTYRLGDRPVDTTLRLLGDGRSTWQVADGTAELLATENGALTINGATIDQPANPVFPGTYTATPTVGLVGLEGEPTVVVPSPDAGPAHLGIRPVLTEEGRAKVQEAVKARLDACLAATESRPANCPFGVDATGVEVQPGSVRFSLANDPWAGFSPALDPDELTATGQLPLRVNATATVLTNGLTLEARTEQVADRTYVVDLTSDPLAVTWR